MCDVAFAQWLVTTSAPVLIETTDEHTVIRVHAFTEEDFACWERTQHGQLIGGYLPRPDRWYVTQELAGGRVIGSPAYGSEDQAAVIADRLVRVSSSLQAA